jgi:hypothetical protein
MNFEENLRKVNRNLRIASVLAVVAAGLIVVICVVILIEKIS